jgi:hypothetical protein
MMSFDLKDEHRRHHILVRQKNNKGHNVPLILKDG